MFDDLSLTHEEQQKAVEQIQKLMAEGMSTAQAIKVVAEQIRLNAQTENKQQQRMEQGATSFFILLSAL